MDSKKVEFTLVITEMILKYGVPAAVQAVQSFSTTDPSIEEIRALKLLVKDPKHYFSSDT
jgi:hypothetical protein